MKQKINSYVQLELPLYPKLKRGQKVRITGVDSTGEYGFLIGKVGIISSMAEEGIWVRFPGRFLARKIPLILLYSIWEIEKCK